MFGSPCHGEQNPSTVNGYKMGSIQTHRCNKLKRTHPHVVGALEKHLIERLWLLAADTDQAASTVGAVLQPEPVPLAPEHGRARSSGTLTHAELHAVAGEEGKAAAAMATAVARGGGVREGRRSRSTKENG